VRRWLLVLPLALLAACGGSAATGSSARPTVLAAASLTEAFDQLGGATFTYAGTSALVTQIRQGAPADVFASADEQHMQELVDAGLVEAPRAFARNALEIVTKPGNPKGVRGLADLARPDVAVALADPSVPVGGYARQVLARAGLDVRAVSLEVDVKAVLTRVTIGDADAGIVYVSDARAAGSKAEGIAIPDDQNVVATYPIAVVKGAPHRAAARAFVRAVLGPKGQAALEAHGFRPA
jgi:molybdate transport system substrate-binding protein